MALVTNRFATGGMHCRSCSMLIEMDVGDLPGVESVTSDHAAGLTEVTYDAAAVRPEDIILAITKAGYAAELVQD